MVPFSNRPKPKWKTYNYSVIGQNDCDGVIDVNDSWMRVNGELNELSEMMSGMMAQS